ncbi:MAG: methylated-DNA--[protein]-cysteine S-methyltransferase [Flavobacteriales bacterium]|nr:methylated-DNA--[protein]-cysteine S-methyltransferase [Flavobacteriales bacterium]
MEEHAWSQAKRDAPLLEGSSVLRIASPIGDLWLRSSGEALAELAFTELTGHAAPAPVLHEAERQLRAYFAGSLRAFTLPLSMAGSLFQRRVWQEVAAIEFGSTMSYQAIAQRLSGSSARAVGHANATNPLPIVVPCHRVIGTDGRLAGYLGGMERKQWLLRHEGALPHDLFTGN